MKLHVKAGATDKTLLVFILDSSSTTGDGLAGVAHSDLTARYIRVETDNDVTISTITMAALTALTDAHSDGGWFEVDATNAPGWYRFDIPDGALAAGAESVGISLIDAGANDIAQVTIEIQLVAIDLDDGVRAGLTALPNAAAAANGGLPTVDGNNRIVGIQGTKNDFDDLNDVSAAQVNAEADQALSDYDPPTRAEATSDKDAILTRLGTPAGADIAADIATVDGNVDTLVTRIPDTISLANIKSQADQALTDINLDHLVLSAVDTDFATTVHLDSVIGQLADPGTTATFDRTTDSLEAIRNRGDAAWITGGDATEASIAALDAKIDIIDGVVDDILLDTGDMQPKLGTPPSGSDILNEIADLQASAGDIETDTQDIQSRLPAALVGGRMSSDAVAISGSTTAADNVEANITNLDVTVSSRSSHSAADIWAVGTRTLTSFGTLVADIWSALTSGLTTVGSIGKLLVDNIDAVLSSRASQASVDGLNDLSAAEVNAEVDSAIETYHLDHLLAVTYDPASKPGAADALLNEIVENDAGISRFTANALEQAPTGGSAPTVEEIADEVQTRTIAAVTTVTNLTATMKSSVNSEVASALATARLDELLTADSDIDGAAPPAVGSVFHELLSKTTGAFTYDQTTDSLEAIRDRGDAAWASGGSDSPGVTTLLSRVPDTISLTNIAASVWDALTSGITTAGSIGKRIIDYLTGDIFARLGAPAGASVSADIAAVKSETASILADTDSLDSTKITAARANNLDQITAARLAELDAANMPADVDAILADTGTDGVVVAAGSKTGYELSASGNNAAADALLKRDMSVISGEAARSPINALRFLRNKFSVVGATLTVYKEDDSTTAWTSTVSSDADADPVTGSDPA